METNRSDLFSQLPNGLLSCNQCIKVFYGLKSIVNHFDQDHGMDFCFIDPGSCDKQRNRTRRHLENLFRVKFVCNVCIKGFKSLRGMQQHTGRMHGE